MKWIGIVALSAAAYATSTDAQAHIRCQTTLGGPCGDSSRPREYNCCDYGYCQPWNSGYYQCIAKPDKCPLQETDIDFAGNDIKTVYGLSPDKCCDECAKTTGCSAYTFVNQNPDGKTACYLKKSDAGRVEKKGAVSANVVVFTTPPPTTPTPPAKCPEQEVDVDYYGNDISNTKGGTQTECCDACAKTLKCVAYSFVANGEGGKSACYLKSSTAGKVAKAGVISGKVKDPLTPEPPLNCPVREKDVDYYGNDIKNLNGVSESDCCDACGKEAKCTVYTYVPATSTCYLKSSAAGKVAKTGVVSGKAKDPFTPPPPPPNCPVQDFDTDYYGNDISNVKGGTQTECCDACAKTAKCVAYSFVSKGDDGKSACYLKSSTAGKVAKAGVISGKVKDPYTPPPPVNCPVQEKDTDYYGNDLKTINGATEADCCDSCGKTTNCVAYSYVPATSTCYLKSSTAGKVAKTGVVSGKIKYIPVPPSCPTQELNIDYYGNDIKNVKGVTYSGCCDACAATFGCKAFTYLEQTPEGVSVCYLKSYAEKKTSKTGAISGLYACPTAPLGQCGGKGVINACCPYDLICQPWSVFYAQCIIPPNKSRCPTVESGVDYYGGDIDVKYGLMPDTCCDACFDNKDCHLFTFIKDSGNGQSACYLKSTLGEKRPKFGAFSGYKVKA